MDNDTACRLCDNHGLAWFTDTGRLVAHDDPRGNTAYECRHESDWVSRVTAEMGSGSAD